MAIIFRVSDTKDALLKKMRQVESTNLTASRAASQPAAAGANPTKAEYDALVAALKTAGIMASA